MQHLIMIYTVWKAIFSVSRVEKIEIFYRNQQDTVKTFEYKIHGTDLSDKPIPITAGLGDLLVDHIEKVRYDENKVRKRKSISLNISKDRYDIVRWSCKKGKK